MFEYEASHFNDLCRVGRVRSQIASLEEARQGAVRKFWLFLIGGILLAAAIAWSLVTSGWPAFGAILAIAVLVVALVLAIRPLSHVSRSLKHPVLETIAEQGGMEYLADGFEPPVFPDAQRLLFGGLSGRAFTDLFHGTDPHGKRFAVYEAKLTRRQGKSTVTVFSGQIYAWQRRSHSSGETAILPDKGLFNFLKPKGMERVKFDSDPEFEKKFEVYSTHSASVLSLLCGDLRSYLVELRRSGRVSVYVGPEDALVAVWGKNRFEPGSMFRSHGGKERVRTMFDDVCASMAALRDLKVRLS
jgi:hypothetical protein